MAAAAESDNGSEVGPIAATGDSAVFASPVKAKAKAPEWEAGASAAAASESSEAKVDDGNIQEAESSLREGLSLNYEEARALLGRLEYQRGNVEAALRVFDGIDLQAAIQRFQPSLSEKPPSKRSNKLRSDSSNSGSQHAASLVLEAIYLKSMSLQKLGKAMEAAQQCKSVLDAVESIFQRGIPDVMVEQKLQETVSKSVELLPELWKQAGAYQEALASYRRALLSQWNLDDECCTRIQKRFAAFLLYGGVEASSPSLASQTEGSFVPKNNLEEAILLLMILLKKWYLGKTHWDPSVMEHLTFGLSLCGQTSVLAKHLEAVLPGISPRTERWYSLALCYFAASHNEAALNLLRKSLNKNESPNDIMALLLASKICSLDYCLASEGVDYARRAVADAELSDGHLKSVALHFLGSCLAKKSKIASSDHQRSLLQAEALKSLNEAVSIDRYNPDLIFDMGIEYAEQRNMHAALKCAKQFIDATGGSVSKGWRLLSLVLSAQQRYSEAEVVTDAALDETAKWEQGPLLRIRAKLKVAQSSPMEAVEAYRTLLALVQAQRKAYGSVKKHGLSPSPSPPTPPPRRRRRLRRATTPQAPATMYRAVSGLGALERHGVDAQVLNSVIRSASTSVAQRSSGGFWSWLTGARSNALPPPDFTLPGVTIPPPLPDHVEPGKTRITTLPNGVKIATDTSAGPSCSVGVYVNCGSVYEAPKTLGATQLLKKLAFGTTTNRSQLRVVREIEATGGNVKASANREMMSYSYAALKTYMPEMVEVLIDCVRNPSFLDWEVKEQIMKLKAELAEASSNPETLLLEALHSTGYSGALANSLIASESSVSRLNTDVLEDFLAENYTAPRIVLAASGVDHDELVSVAEPLLSDIPNVTGSTKPESVYVGGEYRRAADSSNTDVALAFEVPGGWLKEKDFVTVSVLQTLLGGGGMFSWGRHGKGLHSRLNHLLNKFDQIKSISAFKDVHSNTGIFGIHTSTDAAFVPQAIDLAARELTSLATPGQVDQTQLDRAKASVKSAMLMNLESKASATEDMGRQVLVFGERKPVEHLLKVVDGVTLKDVSSLAEKVISSPLTMASHGNVLNVPTYESVSGKFRSK